MKVTKTRLKQIIAEEMDNLRRNPNGGISLTEEPADQLALRLQNEAKGAAMGLLEAGKEMVEAPSHVTASEFGSYVVDMSEVIVDAMVELEQHLTGGDALAEGDEHSRTITQIEKIGDEIAHMAGMVVDQAVLERLEMVDEMITDLVAQMQGVESAPLPHAGVDGAKSVPQ